MKSACALAFGLAAACFAITDAAACYVSNYRTVFFEDLPPRFDAPVAAKVTVTTVSEGNVGAPGSFYAIARVERVLKGTIDRPVVWIPTSRYLSSCGPWIGVGSRGIVLGTLQQSENGALLLFVKKDDGRYYSGFNFEGAKP